MLSNMFLQLLNISLVTSFVIVFILAARLLLKRAPKIFSYALWGVVLFRLICPFSFESLYSLLPTKPAPIPQNIIYSPVPKIDTGIRVFDNAVNAVLPKAELAQSVNPLQILVSIGAIVWLIGAFAMLIYSVISYLKLRARLKNATLYSENIYTASGLNTAFVVGFIRPKIYLPANLSTNEREYILLHEKTHIKRLDHIVKLISFLVLCVHWFNPFVWVAFFYSGKDMEMACDEAVIAKHGDVKKAYSSSLLALSTGKRLIGGTPLAFGENDTKGRVKNILKYKKPAFIIVIIAIVATVIIAAGLLANPKQAEDTPIDTPLSQELEDAIHSAIIAFEENQYHPVDFIAESHIVLDAKEGENDSITVYMKVLTQSISFASGNGFEVLGGSNVPTAITFAKTEDGEYVLFEYFIPRDGSNYAKDIEDKFPKSIVKQALSTDDTQMQMQDCYAQAIEYGKIDAVNMIANIIDDISKMDGDSNSNWEKNAAENELIYFGDYTLKYAFSEFLKDGQADEKAEIMQKAIRNILSQTAEDINYADANSAQEWFWEYFNDSLKLAENHDTDYIIKNRPKAYLLLAQYAQKLADESGTNATRELSIEERALTDKAYSLYLYENKRTSNSKAILRFEIIRDGQTQPFTILPEAPFTENEALQYVHEILKAHNIEDYMPKGELVLQYEDLEKTVKDILQKFEFPIDKDLDVYGMYTSAESKRTHFADGEWRVWAIGKQKASYSITLNPVTREAINISRRAPGSIGGAQTEFAPAQSFTDEEILASANAWYERVFGHAPDNAELSISAARNGGDLNAINKTVHFMYKDKGFSIHIDLSDLSICGYQNSR